MVLHRLEKYNSFAPLFLRLAAGLIFLVAGWGKVTNIENVIGFFTSLNLIAPTVLAWIVGIGELLGGILLLAGIYTRYAAGFLAIIMVGAIALVQAANGWNALRLDIMLLATMLYFVFAGGGKYSLLDDCNCEHKPEKKKKK